MIGQTLSDPQTPQGGPHWPDGGDEDWTQLAGLVLLAYGLDRAAWSIVEVCDAQAADATKLDFNALGSGREWRLTLCARGPQRAEMRFEIEAFWRPAKRRWELSELGG